MSQSVAVPTPDDRSPVGRRPSWTSLRAALHLLQVRLRMPIVLILAAIVVGQWDLIRNYWGRLTRVIYPDSIALQAVSSDTEYFCPMDPGVISDWPSKCGVCNMTLVRRKRGEAVSLPDGVVARMQLSPNRIQLAGIQTVPASFRPLASEYERGGPGDDRSRDRDRGGRDPAQPGGLDRRGAEALARVSRPARSGRTDRADSQRDERDGRGLDASARRWSSSQHRQPEVREGMPVVARFKTPVSAMEPFRSMPQIRLRSKRQSLVGCTFARTIPSTIAVAPGKCPIDQNARVVVPLLELPARSVLVSDASGGHGRSRWRKMRRLRRDGARAAGGLVSARGSGSGRPSVGGDRRRREESGFRREHARHV